MKILLIQKFCENNEMGGLKMSQIRDQRNEKPILSFDYKYMAV